METQLLTPLEESAMLSSLWHNDGPSYLSSVASRLAALFGIRLVMPEGRWRDAALALFDGSVGHIGIMRAATPAAVNAGMLFSDKQAPRYTLALQLALTHAQVEQWRSGLDEFLGWVADGLDEVGESARAEAVASLAVLTRSPRIRCTVDRAIASIRTQLDENHVKQPEGASLIATFPIFPAEFLAMLEAWIARGLVDANPRATGVWASSDQHLAITWGAQMASSILGPLPGVMIAGREVQHFRKAVARLGISVQPWRLGWFEKEGERPLYCSTEPEALALAMFRAGL